VPNRSGHSIPRGRLRAPSRPEQIYRLRGLVDSGVDLSVLPLAYAPLLGYSVADLERVEGQQVQGRIDFWRARRPLTAAIAGLSEIPFELQPSFLDGTSSVLWGRQDFMTHWDFLRSRPVSRGN
jgi:hypothetical protein